MNLCPSRIHFKRTPISKGNLVDQYRQTWTVKQNAEVLDLTVNADDRTLDYGQYPDVLERLSGALNSHTGDFLVVTAKPGYELKDRSSPTHEGGGGHGSIRQTESLVPLIIAGTEEKPAYLRMIDLKAYLLGLLSGHKQMNKKDHLFRARQIHKLNTVIR